MITIQASSIDELNIIWRKLRKDFQVIEGIHLDPKTLQYRMVVNQPSLTKMLKGVSDKVLDRLDLYQDDAMAGIMNLALFHQRIENDPDKYPSLEPIVKIWSLISSTDKKAIFSYLSRMVSNIEQESDSNAIEEDGF